MKWLGDYIALYEAAYISITWSALCAAYNINYINYILVTGNSSKPIIASITLI